MSSSVLIVPVPPLGPDGQRSRTGASDGTTNLTPAASEPCYRAKRRGRPIAQPAGLQPTNGGSEPDTANILGAVRVDTTFLSGYPVLYILQRVEAPRMTQSMHRWRNLASISVEIWPDPERLVEEPPASLDFDRLIGLHSRFAHYNGVILQSAVRVRTR